MPKHSQGTPLSGDHLRKLKEICQTVNVSTLPNAEEEKLVNTAATHITNNLSLLILDDHEIQSTRIGQVRMTILADGEIRWLNSEADSTEESLLTLTLKIDVSKLLQFDTSYHEVVSAAFGRKRMDWKKLRRVLPRFFALMMERNTTLRKALTSTQLLEYEKVISTREPLDIPRKGVRALQVLDTFVVNDKNIRYEIPIARVIYVAENLADRTNIFVSSSRKPLTEPSDFVCGKCISTYPPGPTMDIICDTFLCKVYDNQAQLIIADGCNWGLWPALAAQNASLGFSTYCEKVLLQKQRTKHTQSFGRILQKAINAAHHSILQGHEQYLQQHPHVDPQTPPGTTTLLGGFVLESCPTANNESRTSDFYALFASVGDCKCYRLSKKTGTITDLTQGVRPHALDPCDPGGRLGPYHDLNQYDLRNFRLFMAALDEGDIIILVSDGIHDNLDPIQLGHEPEAYNMRSWDEYANSELLDNHKERALEKLLRDNNATTPAKISEVVINYCMEITNAARTFMEVHPTARQPQDFKLYPGKMDHATILVYTVGSHFCSPSRRISQIPPLIKAASDETFDDSPKRRLSRSMNGKVNTGSGATRRESPVPVARVESDSVLHLQSSSASNLPLSQKSWIDIRQIQTQPPRSSTQSLASNRARNETSLQNTTSSLFGPFPPPEHPPLLEPNDPTSETPVGTNNTPTCLSPEMSIRKNKTSKFPSPVNSFFDQPTKISSEPISLHQVHLEYPNFVEEEEDEPEEQEQPEEDKIEQSLRGFKFDQIKKSSLNKSIDACFPENSGTSTGPSGKVTTEPGASKVPRRKVRSWRVNTEENHSTNIIESLWVRKEVSHTNIIPPNVDVMAISSRLKQGNLKYKSASEWRRSEISSLKSSSLNEIESSVDFFSASENNQNRIDYFKPSTDLLPSTLLTHSSNLPTVIGHTRVLPKDDPLTKSPPETRASVYEKKLAFEAQDNNGNIKSVPRNTTPNVGRRQFTVFSQSPSVSTHRTQFSASSTNMISPPTSPPKFRSPYSIEMLSEFLADREAQISILKDQLAKQDEAMQYLIAQKNSEIEQLKKRIALLENHSSDHPL